MTFNLDQLKQNIESELANPNSEFSKNKIEDDKRQAEKLKQLSPLLAEFGGDSPQARAIAEGLLNQGVSSTKNIGVRQIPEMQTVDINIPDGSDAGWHTESQTVPTGNQTQEFFNKETGEKINPARLGIIKNGEAGVKDGDIFFHLRADDNGKISFEPQWSPRAHGFLRDNPLGQFIMKAGAIIPSPFQPAFVAANVGDALAHGKYAQALLAAVPYGAQELGVTDAIKDAFGFGGPSGLDMGDVIPKMGIADYLPSGLDVGDVIPQGGIAEFAPDQIEQLLDNRLNYPNASFDNPMGAPNAPVGNAATGPVDRIPLDAIKSTNLVLNNGVVDGSPLDVSLADQTFQKIINPLDVDVPIDKMTARSIADSFYNPNGTSIKDIVGSDWSAGTPTDGMLGTPPADVVNGTKVILQNTGAVNSGGLTLDDIIAGKGTTINDIVGSDWSAGTPTNGMDGTPPADVVNGTKFILQNDSLTDPTSLTTEKVVDTDTKLDDTRVDAAGNSKLDLAGTKLDLNGNTINDALTVDKVLDLSKAYLQNPAALAGLVGTGLAVTGLVNNIIGGDKLLDTKQIEKATGDLTSLTSKQVASMVPAGPTPGLQDLFNYADLYKSSVFAPYVQQQTQQTAQQPSQQQIQQQYPGFTVSDVFRSLMADAAPQPKIEPNLVGLADLQKKMMAGK